MKNYLELIETALRNKDYSLMNELITQYLKSEKYSKSARLVASEFYRRISEYSKGLELLHWQNESFRWKSLPDQEIRIRLQSIRLLNLLGASSFAVRMLDTMDEETQQKYYEVIAPIYLSNGRSEAAVRLYSFLLKLPQQEWDYQKRLQLIGLADAYSGLKKYDEAIALAEKLLTISTEPAILAILNEALGSYFVYSGNLKKAAFFQLKAQSFFSANETTVDYGYLLKWIGARLLLEGKHEEAEEYLHRAFSILYKKGLKPEVWLEVLYWQGLLAFKRTGKTPKEWLTLLCYPTTSDRLQQDIAQWITLPSEVALNESAEVKMLLHFKEEMCVERNKNTLGLTLPQKVLSILLAAGEWGVPFYRVCDSIWHDDLYSFGEHFKRLDQGLGRLRKEGLKVEWKDMHLRLLSNRKLEQFQLVMNLKPTLAGGLFFERVANEKDRRFTREEVEGYFSLSRSRAAGLCQQWVGEERVVTEKSGRSVFYRLK